MYPRLEIGIKVATQGPCTCKIRICLALHYHTHDVSAIYMYVNLPLLPYSHYKHILYKMYTYGCIKHCSCLRVECGCGSGQSAAEGEERTRHTCGNTI